MEEPLQSGMKPPADQARCAPDAPVYRAPPIPAPLPLDGNFDKPAWTSAPAATLRHFMGDRPAHFPRTEFRVAYDREALYVIFRVADRYVQAAVAAEFQGPVCHDSCVEFFFTPGPDMHAGYFNLEMNCGGALLLHWQTVPRRGQRVSDADCARIEIFHQLPRIVMPEIETPTVWTVEYRLPLDILKHYAPAITAPAPGAVWLANFYKCGDQTSHPHWLTWAPVRLPQPDFHRPEWFGRLEFEG